MMITTWRILWIPTPGGFGVSTDVVVLSVEPVVDAARVSSRCSPHDSSRRRSPATSERSRHQPASGAAGPGAGRSRPKASCRHLSIDQTIDTDARRDRADVRQGRVNARSASIGSRLRARWRGSSIAIVVRLARLFCARPWFPLEFALLVAGTSPTSIRGSSIGRAFGC